ncbi:MAG: Kef-type K+ transport system membrane component KefB [Polyangiales bacterium]|jgi:Kef-type K+ transport system membrane component KefB
MSEEELPPEEEERATYAVADDEDDDAAVARIASADEVSDEHVHNSAGHGHGGGDGAFLRQVTIIALLVVAMIVLHEFAVPIEGRQYDPTAMLALGFVILACFTIGALVDVVKLPHITGYLLAGIFFGPSIAQFIPFRLLAPFDEGVLNNQVMEQLSPLNTLAVALIALTAGGELKIDQLRRGMRAITGVLAVQLVTVLSFTTAFFWLVSGAVPMLALPGLGDVSAAWLPIGLTVGAISFATSPAATVAIINETGAKGPMTRTVMSSVVLKDVFVVVLFGVFSALAAQSMGQASEGSIVTTLAIEIGGSIVGGILLGGLMGLYLGFVGKYPSSAPPLILFVAGIVYISTLIATELHLDAVLVFITAGFLVSNFSKLGEKLIHSVEQLSMPVYVVFFTLAGAHLELDKVLALLPFAFALVLVRIVAVYLGVRWGAILGGADDGTRKYGWMGFLSQAGVAITFASFLGTDRFPEEVHALSSLLIAGVAFNEVLGPVLLKVALSLAGEVGDKKSEVAMDEVELPSQEFASWPTLVDEVDWAPDFESGSAEVDLLLQELEGDLRSLVRDIDDGPMASFKASGEGFLRDLRREFLRHHRRLLVQARAVGASEDEAAEKAAMAKLVVLLRTEQAELSERWRATVLARAAQLRQRAHWHATDLVEAVDSLGVGFPEQAKVPFAPESFVSRPTDNALKFMRRRWYRLRRGTARVLGRPMNPRKVAFRDLVRFHLSGVTPPKLESTAALLVDAERHLAGRTRNLFDGIVHAYDKLATTDHDRSVTMEKRVAAIREDVEQGLLLALDEVRRMASGGTHRTARTLASGLRGIKDDLPFIATFELPERRRQSSSVFRERVKSLEQLGVAVDALRESCGGEFSLLAMELELVGLEARLKDVVANHEGRLQSELQRRAVQQARRADETLLEALQHVASLLRDRGTPRTGAQLAGEIRQLTDSSEKVTGDASRIVRDMRDELLDSAKFEDLVKAVQDTAETLTSRYEVIAGRMMHGDERLPAPMPSVEVPFRELVSEFTETTVMPKLYRAARAAADELQPLALALKEAERLVAFNVELATAELEVVHDDIVPAETLSLLHEMIFGQLDRVHATVHSFAETSVEWPSTFGQEVREAVLGALDELRGELVDGKITQAKLNVIRKTATRRRLAQQATDLPKILREFREQFKRTTVALIGVERLASWRESLGIRGTKEESSFGQAVFTEPKAITTLPVVYRRLFAADTMEASDVLTGRDEMIRSAREILLPKKSKSGLRRAVALVGPDGVGKASVGGAIVRGGRWKSVARIVLDRPQTLEDVAEHLAKAKQSQLVVLEGLHWLVSTRPGGFAPLRAFVDGMLADGESRSWLVYADELLWRYASAIAPLEDAFPDVVKLEPLTIEELTSAVMERHRLSGYGHAFERIDGDARVETLLARALSKVRSPYEQYFAELHAATGGLVRDALRLWLASIRQIYDDDIVHVGPVPNSNYHVVRALPDEELHTLFLVARQGWMDAPVLANLRRRDERSARAELGRLQHLGVLEGKDGVVRISAHLRGVVGRVLAEKGWSS